MRDEIDGRLWVEHGAAFSRNVAQLVDRLARSWQRLQETRYRAPWRDCSAAGCH